MNLSRRKTLAIVGGGIILAASAAGAAFVTTRTPRRALAPWSAAGDYPDPVKNALSYAILAPNPHNLQPWIVDLPAPDTAVLYRDPARSLPHTDPFSRQITIGLGCFLEQMKIAASQTGHEVELDLFPEGDNGPVAIARFDEGAAPDPLGRQMLARRSCKEPFSMQAIETARVETLADYATLITSPDEVARIRDLTWAAWEVEAQTPRTLKESIDVMRMGKSEIEASPDGIDLGGPMLETMMLLGMLTREAQLDPASEASKAAHKIYAETFAATPAFAVITSQDNNRVSQIEAGARWLRLNLKTTELGLALHPVSQALQEYPEMSALYAEAHELLAADGETLQMLGRLGYGPEVAPAPRWPLEAKLRNA